MALRIGEFELVLSANAANLGLALDASEPRVEVALDGLAVVAVVRRVAPGAYQLLSLRRMGAGRLQHRARGPERDPAAYYATPRRARLAAMRHLGVLVWCLEGQGTAARLEGYGLPDASAGPEPGR